MRSIHEMIWNPDYRYDHLEKEIKVRELNLDKYQDYKAKRRSSRVTTASIFDEINMSIDQFKSIPKEDQQRYLSEWRARFSVPQLAEKLNCRASTLYYYLSKFDLVDKERSALASKNRKIGHVKSKKGKDNTVVEPITETVSTPAPAPQDYTVIPNRNGMQFTFTGTYDAKQIIAKLEKLNLILDDEQNKFEIKLFVEEIPDAM